MTSSIKFGPWWSRMQQEAPVNDRQVWTALLALVITVGFSPSQASAYCQMTTQSDVQIGDTPCSGEGLPLVWTRPCLSYAVDSRGSQWFDSVAEIESLVDQSFAAWRNVDCDARVAVAGSGNPPNLIFKPLTTSTCQRAEYNTEGNVNTIAFLDPWIDPCADPSEAYDPFAFAVTKVWFKPSTGEILDADMMINDSEARRFGLSFTAGGPYEDCPDSGCPSGISGAPGPADLRSIVTHEAGHFIGIGHCSPEDANDPNDPCVQATMFYRTERTSVDKRTLARDDINAVCDIYPPGNLDSSCDETPTGGLLLDCEVDGDGNPIACDGPGVIPASGGGCSASRTANGSSDAPWVALLASAFGLMVLRRRSRRRGARS